MKLPVLIADDEAPARRKLARFLAEHDDIDVVGEASNGVDAVDLIAMTKPELVFLDIRMPDLDGLGVAHAIAQAEKPPAIVFVTAFDQYAVDAFELSALDYLLKPYDRERFDRALTRARRTVQSAQNGAHIAELVAKLRKEDQYLKRILVPNEGRSIFIPVAQIVRFESDGNNVTIRARSGEYSLRSTLDAIESRLDPGQFARVHRAHIVNIDEILEINPWFHGDYKMVL
ncbi:MAG: response regulator transcription factor, partial [Candidatus Eremiobacteraeota bacterium]|nr:response regulator transcription factor [Candidatus Eremiobacteraeota bacterium]